MRVRRAVGSLAVVVLSVPGLVVAASPAGAAQPGPTNSQIERSKAYVAKLERQVRAGAAAVAQAQNALDSLTTQAEIAVEAYNKAQIVASAAQARVVADQAVLDSAAAQVATARTKVGQYAAAAYRGGALTPITAVLTSDGPQSLLYRLSELDAVARNQDAVIQDLHAAQVFQKGVKRQADALSAQASSAATAAAAARAAVQAKVDAQTAAVGKLHQLEQHVNDVLQLARAHVSALERARLQAIAEARAEAAARAAAAIAAADRQRASTPSGVGGGNGTYNNTVSAATERAALNYAESQIGKPYQWGAAGPDTYDCSGLVMWAYAQVGVNVDHWTGYQWNEGAHISLSDLRAGDLVFFATNTNDPNTIHHVGMYIGNGQMVEAPYTGANVRISNAFRPDLIGAVRLYQR